MNASILIITGIFACLFIVLRTVCRIVEIFFLRKETVKRISALKEYFESQNKHSNPFKLFIELFRKSSWRSN